MILQTMIPVVVVVLATAFAAVTDLWKFKVHNALTLPMIGAGVLYHSCVGQWAGFQASLIGAAFGFGTLIIFYILGGVGAGDVKLLAAVGAWLGMPITGYVFLASIVAAAIYAVCLMLCYGTFRESMVKLTLLWYRMTALGRHLRAEDRIEDAVKHADHRRRLVPFAAMTSVGFLATFAWFWNEPDLTWFPYQKAVGIAKLDTRDGHAVAKSKADLHP